MNYSEFERQLRVKLNNDQQALDTDALILAIHGNKEKSRPLFWVWFGVVLFLLSSAIILFTLLDDEKIASAIPTPKIKEVNSTLSNLEHNELNSEKSDVISSNFESIPHNDDNHQSTIFKPRNDAPHADINSSYKKTKSKSLLENNYSEVQSSNQETRGLSNEESQWVPSVAKQNELIQLAKLPNNFSTLNSIYTPSLSIFRKKVECPDFSRKKLFYFELIPEIGLFKPLKTLSQNSAEPSQLFDLRNENEKSLEGLQAALYGIIGLNKLPFYIKTGVSYSRISEKMNLAYEYTRLDTTQGIISITRSQTGDTLTVIYGDIITESNISGNQVRHHYFHMLDIPINLGYLYPIAEKWTLTAEVGLQFNFYMKSSGNILVTPITFDEASRDYYRPSVGLGYNASLGVRRSITDRTDLNLNARWVSFPNSFSHDANPVIQSYNMLGLHAAWIIKF